MKLVSYLTLCLLLLAACTAQGALTTTGSVIPNNLSSWNSGTGVYVGNEGDGTLLLDGASHGQSARAYFSYAAGSTTTSTITGYGTRWECSSSRVGYHGTAELNILAGASMYDGNQTSHIGTYSDGTGTVNVSGSGSLWNGLSTLAIGQEGIGTLNISDGGRVETTDTTIAITGDAVGYVNVDGSGSTLVVSNSFVAGKHSEGHWEITNGGKIQTYKSLLGLYSDGTGTGLVSGSGSQLTTSYYLAVGQQGPGTLTVSNGGSVFASDITTLGVDGNASGTVYVTGAGSTISGYSELAIGKHGSGMLEITDGGSANYPDIYVGNWNDGLGGTATVSGVGSTLTAAQRLLVGRSAPVNSVLNVLDGAVANATGCVAGYNDGTDGTINVSGEGSRLSIFDYLYVGSAGAGELNITEGGLVDVSVNLEIAREVSDTEGAVNMSTGGQLALFGTLNNSINDFLAEVSGNGTIHWWNDSINDWAPISTATMGTDYTLEYQTDGDLWGYTILTVGTVSSDDIPGDANRDGKVDGSDVTILASYWQHGTGGAGGATWDMGDFNGDGQVDGSDVTILASYWQHGTTPAASAVPEPGSIALLLTALLAIGFFRRLKK